MTLMIERERRFLVAACPSRCRSRSMIVQGYLTTGPASVRVRRIDGRFVLTIKTGSGRNRVEIERALAPEEFEALWAVATDLRIAKRRHRIDLDDGNTAELDLFDDDLAGKRLVEVEFTDDQSADEFVAPDWFGREVTEDGRYTNASLARNGWPTATTMSMRASTAPSRWRARSVHEQRARERRPRETAPRSGSR